MRMLRIALLLAVIGCADLKDIFSLQRGLSREFHTNAVSVNLNNSAYLTITFGNVPVADSAESARAAFARRVGEYVRDHYGHYERLQSVAVGFSSSSSAGPVRFTSSEVPYRFTAAELGAPVTTSKILSKEPR